MTPEEFDIMIRDTLRYLDMEDESDLLNKKIEDGRILQDKTLQ